jgi:type VI secretion system protein ImpJ
MGEQVHWSEGLFLQPHHLQVMQRSLLGGVVETRRLGWSFPYGLIEAKLSSDALQNHTIKFDRLRAILPSGLALDFPENADLPPLDIKQAFVGGQPFTISLAVPIWYPTRGNTIQNNSTDGSRSKRLYQVKEINQADENTGENPQPISVRRLNARLLLDEDDRSDMEVLPLIRIVHATGQDSGLPSPDSLFIPPCLVLQGSAAMIDIVRNLANQVAASRKKMAAEIVRGGFKLDALRAPQFGQLLRLRTLNRFAARLPHLAEAPAITPFEVYLELRELLGELAALQPERDEFEVANYDHDNPAIAFNELNDRIRPYLRDVEHETFARVPFTRVGSVYSATLTADHITRPSDYFIGIKTGEDGRLVVPLVENPDKFKFMPRSRSNMRVRGILLREERQPPQVLERGVLYFRVLRPESKVMWEFAKADKELHIHWSGMEASDYQIALYMTLPTVEEAKR